MLRALVLLVLLALSSCGREAAPPEAARPSVPAGEAGPVEVPAGIVIPEGMAYVPAGTTLIGLVEGGMDDERPAFAAKVRAFALDRSPVTVARFRAFAEATGYRTQAEGFGDAAVMDLATGTWALVKGADWRRPFGADGPTALDDHPVTQVSWNDAAAFCAWDTSSTGTARRLPSEVEWEHAARGGVNDRSAYAWGDALGEGEDARANTWTGSFPGHDDGADGAQGRTSPVGAFGATPLGLTDMGGNVWEWTASWYQPYPLDADAGTGPGAPVGPTGAPERAQRGGSFLCHASYCHGYRVSARSHATAESAAAHVGFRCAADLQGASRPRQLPQDALAGRPVRA